jgi:hypothetical protein
VSPVLSPRSVANLARRSNFVRQWRPVDSARAEITYHSMQFVEPPGNGASIARSKAGNRDAVWR